MKTGKSVKLKLYSPIKTIYGTVDSKKLKSLYINIQSWVTPSKDSENWKRVVNNLCRDIKLTLNESINTTIFEPNYIVDLDLRTSGISCGKKSFFNLEINLFIDREIDFKSSEVKESVKKLIRDIYYNDIINNEYFHFSLTKQDITENYVNS
jgi:hypothetical protein